MPLFPFILLPIVLAAASEGADRERFIARIRMFELQRMYRQAVQEMGLEASACRILSVFRKAVEHDLSSPLGRDLLSFHSRFANLFEYVQAWNSAAHKEGLRMEVLLHSLRLMNGQGQEFVTVSEVFFGGLKAEDIEDRVQGYAAIMSQDGVFGFSEDPSARSTWFWPWSPAKAPWAIFQASIPKFLASYLVPPAGFKRVPLDIVRRTYKELAREGKMLGGEDNMKNVSFVKFSPSEFDAKDPRVVEGLSDRCLPEGCPDEEEEPEEAKAWNEALEEIQQELSGWYFASCMPGCMPDSDWIGPHASEWEAVEEADRMFSSDEGEEEEEEEEDED
jgi:hypothetical protein